MLTNSRNGWGVCDVCGEEKLISSINLGRFMVGFAACKDCDTPPRKHKNEIKENNEYNKFNKRQ